MAPLLLRHAKALLDSDPYLRHRDVEVALFFRDIITSKRTYSAIGSMVCWISIEIKDFLPLKDLKSMKTLA